MTVARLDLWCKLSVSHEKIPTPIGCTRWCPKHHPDNLKLSSLLSPANKHVSIEKKWVWKKSSFKAPSTLRIFAHLCAKPQQHMTSSSSNHHFYSRKSTRKSNGSAQGTDTSLKLPRARAIVAMPTSSVALMWIAVKDFPLTRMAILERLEDIVDSYNQNRSSCLLQQNDTWNN